MTNAVSLAQQASTGVSQGFKNRIINGAMVIDQRNAGASVTIPAVNPQYTLDRWGISSSQASKISIQQNAGSVTPPAGFTNYLGVTSLSAYSVGTNDYFRIGQNIEGFNTADLNWGTANAKTVTLSFWVYSSLTGMFGGALGNNAGNRSYPFSYTISAANTWEYKTITIAGDTTGTWLTNNSSGIVLYIALGYGSTYGGGTAGAWVSSNTQSVTGATSVVGTNGATFYITGVQLEVGSTATSFDYRPYGTELNLCKRYFSTYIKGANNSFGMGFYYNSSIWHQPVRFEQQMRTTPSLVVVTGTDYYKVEKSTGGNDTFNGYLLARENEWGGLLYNTTEVSGTAGDAWEAVTLSNSSYVGFSAEL